MFKPSLSVVLMSVLVFAPALTPSVLAETSAEKNAAHAAKMKAEIAKLGTGPDAQLAVKLRDKTKLTGYVSQTNAASFVLTDAKTGIATDVPYANVTQAKGKNLSTGVKIAITAGVIFGVLLLTWFIVYHALEN
ncbi:MAG: hypothetical protein HYR56_24070 [Acidobacteria bacterium]|nr:hypothetical protein [Acidobacteriota bacterium]MBI3427966.1 hypothetical protein [Acidobacteriota bacterium]